MAASESRTLTFRSYLELEALFDELSYTPEAWMAGIREVPRLYISEIPERWSQRTVKEIDVLTKKRLFFRLLAPLVLRSNELILEDRKRLVRIGAMIAAGGQPAPADIEALHALAERYRLARKFHESPSLWVGARRGWRRSGPTGIAVAMAGGKSKPAMARSSHRPDRRKPATKCIAGKRHFPSRNPSVVDIPGRSREISGLEPAEYDDPAALVAELTLRVDVIPLSLALSQAAEESGWGTSRFAFHGNALFGQWTWGEGIRPAAQRAGRGDYKIAAFETPLQSVQAHARNLNTHPAYGEIRAARAARRQAMETLRGSDLAATLTQYSERGDEYVTTLRAIMRSNRLDAADDAYLGTAEPIMLIPADA